MILLELGKLRTRVANSQKKEKEMCQRMIQGFNKDSGTDKGGSGKVSIEIIGLILTFVFD